MLILKKIPRHCTCQQVMTWLKLTSSITLKRFIIKILLRFHPFFFYKLSSLIIKRSIGNMEATPIIKIIMIIKE